MVVEVSAIFLYPVKSCRGIPLSTATLSPTGLCWDRQWMIVNSKGKFVTQRELPILATIEVYLPVEALDHNWSPLGTESALCLKAPGMGLLYVPLAPSYERERIEVTIWEWSGRAFDEGATASEWLSDYIGKSGLRLVRFDTEGETRPTDTRFAPGFKTAFADGYPILLFSEASMEALNSRLPESLPLNRFRPNIVVKGCEPFEEDLWRRFSIDNHNFQGVALCPRCKITTIDQETGKVGKEPLPTLKKFRVGQALGSNPSMRGKMYFGQNVGCEVKEGEARTVNIGDVLHIKEKAASVSELMVGV
ncbi:hypothetical protein R1flu_006039 [Riccia fluitans]|uniref:MOSC domain-containing protein n=1 Tax=Riccia fluitans TaxID=41844 RepID=A0ABD1YV60_9MARC